MKLWGTRNDLWCEMRLRLVVGCKFVCDHMVVCEIAHILMQFCNKEEWLCKQHNIRNPAKACKPWVPLISTPPPINSHLYFIFRPFIYPSIWYTSILHQSMLSCILSWCTLGFQKMCLGILLHGVTQKRFVMQGDALVSMKVWLFGTNKLTLSHPFIKCLHTSCINIPNIIYTLYPSHFITLLNIVV